MLFVLLLFILFMYFIVLYFILFIQTTKWPTLKLRKMDLDWISMILTPVFTEFEHSWAKPVGSRKYQSTKRYFSIKAIERLLNK